MVFQMLPLADGVVFHHPNTRNYKYILLSFCLPSIPWSLPILEAAGLSLRCSSAWLWPLAGVWCLRFSALEAAGEGWELGPWKHGENQQGKASLRELVPFNREAHFFCYLLFLDHGLSLLRDEVYITP